MSEKIPFGNIKIEMSPEGVKVFLNNKVLEDKQAAALIRKLLEHEGDEQGTALLKTALSRLQSNLKENTEMTFFANSMTYRIDPSKWEAMPNYRLKDEFDEFLRWFGYNMPGMKERDAVRGWNLIAELKSILENRGVDMTEYMHVDSVANNDDQISFFKN